MELLAFWLACLQYERVYPASETSAGRTCRHNTDVGGVKHSAHVVHLARDVTYDVQPPLDEATTWAKRLSLTLIREGDHDHLQPSDWEAG